MGRFHSRVGQRQTPTISEARNSRGTKKRGLGTIHGTIARKNENPHLQLSEISELADGGFQSSGNNSTPVELFAQGIRAWEPEIRILVNRETVKCG